MAQISANTTLTFDGVTMIDVNGTDQYSWTALTLESLFVSPASGGLTLTLNLVGDWVAGLLKVSGSLTTIINDDSASGSRYFDMIMLGDGGDTVSLSRTSTEALSTGAGDDLIEIDEVWIGWLHAGAGNDTLTLRSNASMNMLDLGEGTNTVTVEGDAYGVDTINGRTGVDTVYAYADVGLISTRSGNDRVETSGNWVGRIDAGSGNDTVIADGDVEIITTQAGDDRVETYGYFILVGTIDTGLGNDTVVAHGDVDVITTQDGDDRIETEGNWVDIIDAGSGNDTIIAEGLGRMILAGYGADHVTTTEGTRMHLINGGDGDDTLLISGEADFIYGDYGNDTITTGDAWVGTIDAGAGRDVVTLGGGTTVYVDLGYDADNLNVGIQIDPTQRIVANGGNSFSAPGGTDRDLVSFATFTAGVEVRLDLERAKSAQGNLTLIDFENATGGAGNDLLFGDSQDNVLRGGAGNDTLVGGAGRDGLFGGLGADTFRFYRVDEKTDYVSDFKRVQGDKIDLRLLDANTTRAGDQAFTFIGTQSFHDRAGEVRVTDGDGWLRLSGDTDGDGIAEFNIVLYASATSSDIRAADFLL